MAGLGKRAVSTEQKGTETETEQKGTETETEQAGTETETEQAGTETETEQEGTETETEQEGTESEEGTESGAGASAPSALLASLLAMGIPSSAGTSGDAPVRRGRPKSDTVKVDGMALSGRKVVTLASQDAESIGDWNATDYPEIPADTLANLKDDQVLVYCIDRAVWHVGQATDIGRLDRRSTRRAGTVPASHSSGTSGGQGKRELPAVALAVDLGMFADTPKDTGTSGASDGVDRPTDAEIIECSGYISTRILALYAEIKAAYPAGIRIPLTTESASTHLGTYANRPSVVRLAVRSIVAAGEASGVKIPLSVTRPRRDSGDVPALVLT